MFPIIAKYPLSHAGHRHSSDMVLLHSTWPIRPPPPHSCISSSGVARGPRPPPKKKLLVNGFLCNEFMLLLSRPVSLHKRRVISRSPCNVPKSPGIEDIFPMLTRTYRKKKPATTPPPPECGRLWRSRKMYRVASAGCPPPKKNHDYDVGIIDSFLPLFFRLTVLSNLAALTTWPKYRHFFICMDFNKYGSAFALL